MIFAVSAAPYLQVHGTSHSSIKQLVKDLIDIGIGGIKVSCGDPEFGFTGISCSQNVIHIAQLAGLNICAHAPVSDISAVDPTIRMRAVASVNRAITTLGSSLPGVVFTVHPEDFAPLRQHGDDQARIESCRRSLETLAVTASDVGALIALENMRWRPDAPNRTGMTVDQLSTIVEGIDPPVVGLCFDTGHANISENHDLVGAFERNATRIIHIHYHDNVGNDDLHLAPGNGNIDFAAFFKSALKTSYSGMVELEVQVPGGDDPTAFYKRTYQKFLHTLNNIT